MTYPAPMPVDNTDQRPPTNLDAELAASPARFFNRELSWLAFNQRVLDEACNGAHPLLERLRFLSISASNLDEFFMVRVAGLKAQQLLGVEEISPDGLNPAQQIAAITLGVDRLTASQEEVWSVLSAQLREAGVSVLGEAEIPPDQFDWLDQHFHDHIFPVLTPQALDPAHPFPFIRNKGFSLIFDLKRVSGGEPIRELLMVPATLPRFIRMPGEAAHYVAIETLIRRRIGATSLLAKFNPSQTADNNRISAITPYISANATCTPNRRASSPWYSITLSCVCCR